MSGRPHQAERSVSFPRFACHFDGSSGAAEGMLENSRISRRIRIERCGRRANSIDVRGRMGAKKRRFVGWFRFAPFPIGMPLF
jgi:hypothetical protein